jgi:signal transduction histidine kinase
MPSQWLAVGSESDPLRRARELQKGWERLLADGALGSDLPPGATAGLRPTIVESWRRSLATGLDPTDLLAPIEADESEVLGRWFEHPLGSLSDVLTEQLRKVAEESRSVVVVTDASGLVLHRVGDESLKERAAEMHLVEGARYSEAADGTNGIGTALAADQAFQVFAFEHFNERHHQWICSGAPVHDPVSGQTIGLIDLSSLWTIAHPRSLELVTTAARTIEERLMDARRDRDTRLRRRYSDFMTRRADLLVDRDGYVLDGAERPHRKPFDIPDGGGEVVLGDGSVAVAAPLGQGEAYLLSQVTTRHAKSAPVEVEVLERAERHVRELVTEQAALRQVATLVARESSPDQLFAVVADQVARIFDVPHVRLVRYEPDGSVVVGGFSEGDHEPFPIGSRWPLDSPGVTATVRQSGRPARVEDYEHMTGEIAAVVRGAGMRSAVASPIVVERRLWGAMLVLSPRREPFPEDTEARLTDFTELVATAIANAESRVAIGRLLDEQAALRRVATLVAQGASPQDLFEAVAEEVGRLLLAANVSIGRYEPDGSVTSMASWSSAGPVFTPGRRWPIKGTNVAWMVLQTGRPARIDDFSAATDPIGVAVREAGYKSAIGSPIVVEGHLWGAISAASTEGPMPLGSEARLASFTELVATAVANTQARQEVTVLADEQAALRRVATLVARGASHAQVFSTIAREIGELLGLEMLRMVRYEDDGTGVVVAGSGLAEDLFPVGLRIGLAVDSAASRVFRTREAVRIDNYETASDAMTQIVRSAGIRGVVATPIWVEGRLWGVMNAATTQDEPLPPDTEARLGEFTELMATAIANAESKSELAASRRRIVAASDETRRRIERDLHDGTQQRLVSLGLAVRAAEANLPPEREDLRAQLSGVATGLVAAVEDLQEISRGIHPAILSKGGLGPALRALAHRSAIPVDLDIATDMRLEEPVEVAAYFVASEALANAAKHSDASRIDVSLEQRDGRLLLSVRDDGIGGADAARGSGLVGLTDRVEALGGSIRVSSRPRKAAEREVCAPIMFELDRGRHGAELRDRWRCMRSVRERRHSCIVWSSLLSHSASRRWLPRQTLRPSAVFRPRFGTARFRSGATARSEAARRSS